MWCMNTCAQPLLSVYHSIYECLVPCIVPYSSTSTLNNVVATKYASQGTFSDLEN